MAGENVGQDVIRKALEASGFDRPNPVQQAALDAGLLDGADGLVDRVADDAGNDLAAGLGRKLPGGRNALQRAWMNFVVALFHEDKYVVCHGSLRFYV